MDIKIRKILTICMILMTSACSMKNTDSKQIDPGNVQKGILELFIDHRDKYTDFYLKQPTTLNEKYEKFKTMEVMKTKVEQPGGLITRKGDWIVTDTKKDQLLQVDYQGKLIKKIGMTGNGKLEFLKPEDITQDQKYIYVLDSGNQRVQVLDHDLQYVSEISVADQLKEFQDIGLTSIAVDKKGNLYIASGMGQIDQILYISKDQKSIQFMGDNFFGSVSNDENGEVYAISLGTKIKDSEDYVDEFNSGFNHLYRLDQGTFHLIKTLDYAIHPSGLIKEKDQYVMISTALENIMVYGTNGNYKYSSQKLGEIGLYGYMKKGFDGNYYISLPEQGKIYRMKR